jgi:hypothetical protein
MPVMTYDIRTIALLTEIIYPPRDLQAALIQGVHNRLYSHARFSYQNFGVTNEGILLSNPPTQPGAVSSVNFLPDRMQLREELTSTDLEQYRERLTTVLGAACERLGLQATGATQCVVRSLVNPRHFRDSRDFIGRRMCRFDSRSMSSLGRPAGALGLRLLFPQTTDNSNYFALRLESFNQDPRSLFVENVGTFTQTQLPGGIDIISDWMQQTYEFVSGATCEFIARFDSPEAQ